MPKPNMCLKRCFCDLQNGTEKSFAASVLNTDGLLLLHGSERTGLGVVSVLSGECV